MKLTQGSSPSENTSLLPQTNNNNAVQSAESDDDSVDPPGVFSEMQKTCHNDPILMMQDMQDVHKLHGSTLILRNSISQERHSSASLRGVTEEHDQHPPAQPTRRASLVSTVSTVYHHQQESTVLFLEKIKSSFFEDAKSLAAGTIPQSVVLAVVIGTVCGIACWLYYTALNFFLKLIWETIPEQFIQGSHWWPEEYYWLWIPLVSFTMVTLVGLTVVYLGEPGDLPYTISRVHHFAYIPMEHATPMALASLFSILAGGSLGPEAPLVAICGSLGGFVSRRVFRQKYVNVVRKHTLMGMAGALSAFFGAPLGGSLFALEVNSRFGIEYFEHMVESIFCGEICLIVFRSMSGMAIVPIWDLTSAENGRMFEIEPWLVIVGGIFGLIGAFFAYLFAVFHSANMAFFSSLNLLDNSRAVYRAWLGVIFIVVIGVLVPHTMFWGEEEFQIVATMAPAKDLPIIWPTTGLSGFEMDTPWKALLVGFAKLLAISFAVAGGLRGGYIFPLICSGAAFGRFVHHFCPDAIPMQVAVLCMAAGLNVAITRTALATTLIVSFLAGEAAAAPPILMASLCSLFATAYLVRSIIQ
jgi:H+/Cl- antiporter ClcA